jgi:beta-aspartyl-peptidase (threonine type)
MITSYLVSKNSGAMKGFAMIRCWPSFQKSELLTDVVHKDAIHSIRNSPHFPCLLVFLMFLLMFTVSCAESPPASKVVLAREHPVLFILQDQESAWNEGDIERFMGYYWKSDSLTFSSTGATTRGWEETLANYRKRYPTVEKMGKTRFYDLEVYPLCDEAALVLGRWSLSRQPDPLKGNFSVVFRKIEGRWVIIHDHTSRVSEDGARASEEMEN